jgi:predicted secreted protein
VVRLTARAGAPFEVALGSAPSTGYQWEPVQLPPGVALLSTRFEQPPNAAIGDGGTQFFVLQAAAAGRLMLNFILKRRWEAEGVQSRTVEVEVA